MTQDIRIVMAASINEGKVEEVKHILSEAISISKAKDTGLLSYEFFISDSEDAVYSIEWFKDSNALLTHMGNVGDGLQQLMAVIEVQRLEVFGDASNGVIEAFRPMNATFAKHWNGFTR